MGDQGPKDPNEATEPRGNITKPKGSPAELYAERENPVVETPTPFSGLKEGGGGSQ